MPRERVLGGALWPRPNNRQGEDKMISIRADIGHPPSSRTRGHRGPTDATYGADFRRSEDSIFQEVGADREVLLIGPDAVRFAGGLSDRRCRIAVVGCGPAQAQMVGLGPL